MRYITLVLSGVAVFGVAGCVTPASEHITITEVQPSTDVAQGDASVLRFAQGAPSATQQFLRALDGLYREDPSLLAGRVRSNALSVQSAFRNNPIRPDVSLVGQTFDDQTLSLQVRQPLIDFGKRLAEVDQLNAQKGLADQSVDDLRHALLSEALSAIEITRFAKFRIALHQRQIKDYGDARIAAQRLVNLNLATAAELRFAEVEQQRAQIELDRAKQDLADAAFRWNHLFGDMQLDTRVEPNALRKASGIAQLDAAQRIAATSNLTLRDLRAQGRLLTANRNLEERRRLPTINAAADLDLLELNDSPLSAGLLVDVPIFKRGHKETLSRLNADVSANSAEVVSLHRDVSVSLQRANQRAVSAKALAKQQRQTGALLRQRVEDVNLQVSNGLAKYTDVIEARVDVFEAELNALTSDHEARLAETEIILATGVLVP